MLTGRQIAAARALLGMAQPELAMAANISVPTLKRMEASAGEVSGLKNNIGAVKAALEAAGITFIDERTTSAAGGPGVRLSVPLTTSIDTNSQETVQYPEMKDGPFGAGG